MESWEKKLREEIRDVLDEKSRNVSIQIVEAGKPWYKHYVIYPLVLIAGAILGAAYYMSRPTPSDPCVPVVTENSMIRETMLNQEDRITLLGNVNNENVMLLREMFPNDPRVNSMILFGKDWRMSRMPSHLKVSRRSRHFLESWTDPYKP